MYEDSTAVCHDVFNEFAYVREQCNHVLHEVTDANVLVLDEAMGTCACKLGGG